MTSDDRAAMLAAAERANAWDDVERSWFEAGWNASRAEDRRDLAAEEISRLRAALDKAAGRLGYLSTVLSHSNKPNNAKGAWEWSEEARAALSTTDRTVRDG